jgi:hypothetical protein
MLIELIATTSTTSANPGKMEKMMTIANNDQMRAVKIHRFGGPEELEIQSVTIPGRTYGLANLARTLVVCCDGFADHP